MKSYYVQEFYNFKRFKQTRLDHIRDQEACFGLVVLACVSTSQISVRGANSSPPPSATTGKV